MARWLAASACLVMSACALAEDDEGGSEQTPDVCETPTRELSWSRLEQGSYPRSVLIDPTSDDGGFFVGYSWSGPLQPCLTRHAADGSEIATISAPACEQAAAAEDGVLLVGTIADDAGDRARVAKLDVDGNELWAVERTDDENLADGVGVAAASNGDVVAIGRDSSGIEWVWGLDADGGERWVVDLAGVHAEPMQPKIAVSDNGDVTVGRTVRNDDAVDVAVARVHRLDRDGQQVWTFDIDGDEIRLEAMAVDAEGRTLVGWYTYDSGLNEATRWMSLVATDGTTTWTRNSQDTAIEVTEAMAFSPCGTILVAGGGDPGESTYSSERRIWVAELDLDGEPLWSEMIDGPYDQPDGADYIQSIAIDPNGDLIVAGLMTVDMRDGFEGRESVYDRWLARFDL